MSAGSFKQDSLNWRINLIKQQVSEWLEYQLSRLNFERQPDGDYWGLELLWQIVRFFLWSLIAILLVWMVWQLWLLLRPYWRRWQRDNRDSSIPNVPVSNLATTDWVERSQSARLEGNYRQAIFCLYQAMLGLLDERDIIAFQTTLTDEEYRRSLAKTEVSPLSPYELLLSIHQRLCFGNSEADRALYEQCQKAYQQIASS